MAHHLPAWRVRAMAAATLLALGMNAAHAAEPQDGDRLCALQPAAAPPVAATLPGCDEAVCTAVGAEQACNCRRGERWFGQRRSSGRLLQQWATEVSPLMGADALQVTQADLEGSGRPAWLLAQFLAQSNGLGVSLHRLCVVWPQAPGRAPLCREVSEWQQLTVLVSEAGRPGCSLVDTQWLSGLDRRDRPRGPGTYAVGRLWRLQGGRWQPAREREAVSRRLLQSFMDERETLAERNAQRLWYQHPEARVGAPDSR